MSRKYKLTALTADISRLLEESNNGVDKSVILNTNFDNLKFVYYRLPKLRKIIDYLLDSNIKEDIIKQDKFFKSNYFNYLKLNMECDVPDSVQEIITFYNQYNEDSYFSYKEMYNYVFNESSKKLQNTYDLKFGKIKEYFSRGTYCTYCSVCQQRINIGSRDLDHFLNKQYFPILCLMQENLIPMCTICNRIYKQTELPQLPVVHPFQVKFPIENIPIRLKTLTELEIIDADLPPEYINYIKLMDLKNRLTHLDIKKNLEDIIWAVQEESRKQVTKGMNFKSVLKIVNDVITDYINSELLVIASYFYINTKILESMNNSIFSKRIACKIHREVNN